MQRNPSIDKSEKSFDPEPSFSENRAPISLTSQIFDADVVISSSSLVSHDSTSHLKNDSPSDGNTDSSMSKFQSSLTSFLEIINAEQVFARNLRNSSHYLIDS